MTTELFHFTGADGKDYTLPKRLSSGALRKVRAMDNVDANYTLFEMHASEEAIAAHDALDFNDGIRILNAWLGGMKAGESSPSSN